MRIPVLLLSLTFCNLALAQEAPPAAEAGSDTTSADGASGVDPQAEQAHASDSQARAQSNPLPASGTPAPDVDLQARRLFLAGRDAYDSGRYSEAVALWERAFDLSGRATLLLGLGDAYDHMREDHRAVSVLRQYLVLEPESSRREQIEARIDSLLRDAGPEFAGGRAAAYVFAAAAGASGILSGLYWARAQRRYSTLAATCGDTVRGCTNGQIDVVRRSQRISRWTLAFAVGTSVAAVVAYLLDRRARRHRRERNRGWALGATP